MCRVRGCVWLPDGSWQCSWDTLSSPFWARAQCRACWADDGSLGADCLRGRGRGHLWGSPFGELADVFRHWLPDGSNLLDSESAVLRFMGGAGLLGLVTFLIGQFHFSVWSSVAILLGAALLMALLILVFQADKAVPRVRNAMTFLFAAGIVGCAWYVRGMCATGSCWAAHFIRHHRCCVIGFPHRLSPSKHPSTSKPESRCAGRASAKELRICCCCHFV